MTTIVRTEPALCSPPAQNEQNFGLAAIFDGDGCVVGVTGELDLAARDRLFLACTARHHLSIVVDLSGLIFMDCRGYGGMVASHNIVEADGRTLTVRGAPGNPRGFSVWSRISNADHHACSNQSTPSTCSASAHSPLRKGETV